MAASFDEELLAAGRKFTDETLRAMAVYGIQAVKYQLNEIKPVIEAKGLTITWPEPSPPIWTSDYWDYANLAEHILEDRE